MQNQLQQLVMQALETARKQGLTQKELAARSALDEVALSRLKKARDARFSTLEELGRSVGKKLVWVDDNSELPELVRQGKVFW